MLSVLKSILAHPAANPLALALIVAIAILSVLVVVLVILGIAYGDRGEFTPEEAGLLRQRQRRERAGCLAAAMLVLVGAIAATALWYHETSTTKYCTQTCHAMAAATQTWRTSAHTDVTCIRCHEGTGVDGVETGLLLRVGSLLSQATGRPVVHIPVPQSRCMECHEAILDTTMAARNGESFTHRAALAGGASCRNCHGVQGHTPKRPAN